MHMARKVVGVGSVGTRCWIFLMLGRDNTDPLFLHQPLAHDHPLAVLALPGPANGSSTDGWASLACRNTERPPTSCRQRSLSSPAAILVGALCDGALDGDRYGKTWQLSAGPSWYWGDKNPLNAYVGKSVGIHRSSTRPDGYRCRHQ